MMKLSSTSSIATDQFQKLEFDLFICSSGYEKRSSYIAKHLNINAPAKIALGFKNFAQSEERKKNDLFFQENGFKVIMLDDTAQSDIYKLIDAVLAGSSDIVNIAIDYSSMTRTWYSAMLSYVNHVDSDKEINLYFVYTFGKFEKPLKRQVRNIHIGPIENFTSLSIPDKPTALIIGLGYERDRAFGLTEYLDAETYVFYNDLSRGADYHEEVIKANDELLKLIKKENVFEYPIGNLDYTESLLYSVCRSLSSDYRIVLAPTGPKPFTLICLLVSLRMKNVDVWRISAGKEAEPYNRESDGTIVSYKACFVPVESAVTNA